MADVSVKQFAEVLKVPAEKLLQQFADAGIELDNENSSVTDEQKMQLLSHLRQSHGKAEAESGRKITLKRRSSGELKVGAGGKARTVNVEVRKKRTYVKRDEVLEAEKARQAEEEAKLKAVREQEAAEREALEAARRKANDEKRAEEAAKSATSAASGEPEQAVEPSQEQVDEPNQVTAERDTAEQDAAEQDAAAQDTAETVDTAAASDEASAAEQADATESASEDTSDVVTADASDSSDEDATDEADGAEPDKAGKPVKAVIAPSEADVRLAMQSRKEKAEREKAAQQRKDAKKGGANTRYGRAELHVAAGAADRRKSKRKSRSAVEVKVDNAHQFEKPTAPVVRDVDVPDSISVGDLAQRMAVKANDVIKTLMGMGAMVTINQVIDQDTASLVVEEMGHNAKPVSEVEPDEILLQDAVQNDSEATPRPPVVTIMGHVDHGKTSLLDYIRRAKVAAGEAGGITQHIGAYHVETDKGVISFLDTPGHAAFTAMRARGSQVTDIVIIVVAADDGVMPQTVEAIQHAKAADVPVIIAVNKIDKEEADPDRVKNELSAHEIIPEDWGGEHQFMHVSALTGAGVDELLDAISLQAEILELTAPTEGAAKGMVIESSLEKGRGPVATVLVQSGTLNQGDVILCGQEYGRVRAMFDENGQAIKSAAPSIPAQVLGLSGVPNAGDEMLVLPDDKKAREVAELRSHRERESKLAKQQAARLTEMFTKMEEGNVETVNLLVKADVQGSAEALIESLQKLSTDEVRVKVIASGVGGITETDASLAAASQAVVIGFNVRADAGARRVAEESEVEIRYYSVIYEALDDVKDAMSGLLSPELREEIVGVAEVREVFRSSEFGAIAGCLVLEGNVKRANPIRVLRNNTVIYEGELESLRRFKDEVSVVEAGTECGIGVKNYNDVQPGDSIEVFERIEIARTID